MATCDIKTCKIYVPLLFNGGIASNIKYEALLKMKEVSKTWNYFLITKRKFLWQLHTKLTLKNKYREEILLTLKSLGWGRLFSHVEWKQIMYVGPSASWGCHLRLKNFPPFNENSNRFGISEFAWIEAFSLYTTNLKLIIESKRPKCFIICESAALSLMFLSCSYQQFPCHFLALEIFPLENVFTAKNTLNLQWN